MLLELLFAIGCYFVGSIPAVYLIGRLRGVDLRTQGSRNVGGSNLWQTTGATEGIIGSLADIVKGVAPVFVAKTLGFGPAGMALAVAGCMGGQMWPVFLKFQGGRGNGMALGIGLVLGPRELGLSIIPMLAGALPWFVPRLLSMSEARRQGFRFIGARTKIVPVGMLCGFLLLPLLGLAFQEQPSIVIALAVVPGMIVFRRLTAELGDDLRQPGSKRAIFVNRLLFDRRDREQPLTLPQP
ncbi:MAG: glycerol-3-phosphate acyltransferase [Dehalococcoidia bacterium]|nr:glycerol-3-phosphate acyltransferase [Dehalococcoidia bacterium]